MPKGLAPDPANGILAARQFEAGISPDLRTLVTPCAEDLSSDVHSTVSWWPPSYQAVPFALVALGFSWGRSLTAVVAVCVIVGLLGWAWYFRQFGVSWSMTGLWLLLVVASPWTQETAVLYQGGDLLLWTVAPFLISINVSALRPSFGRASAAMAFLGGIGCTAVYALKYSGACLGIGILAAYVCRCFQRGDAGVKKKFAAWTFGALLGMTVLARAGLMGGETPASSAGTYLRLIDGAAALGLWPTSMTGVGPMIAAVWPRVFSFARGLNVNLEYLSASIGWLVLLSLAILMLLAKDRSASTTGLVCPILGDTGRMRDPLMFAIVVASTDTLLYAGIIGLGAHVSVMSRLAQVSGLVLMPPVFLLLIRCFSGRRALSRVVSATLVAVLFVFPPVFGVLRSAVTVAKLAPLRKDLAGDEYVAQWHLGEDVVCRAFYSEILRDMPSTRTIIYTVWPDMLFPIPDRRFIYRPAEWDSVEALRERRYRQVPPEGVALLLPLSFAQNGKLNAIETSFPDVRTWRYRRLDTSTKWGLWISERLLN